ncbi:MAG TPA: hypothetical protein VGR25_11735 [bacterium]|nr:hypothetical protein [bacterium]HEV8703296.1 hypothetical protein [Candidatus Polarisedimenticolia bacterium]
MATSRQPRHPSPPPAGDVAGERKRIPLPPLPHFRSAQAKQPAIPADPGGMRIAPPVAPPAASPVNPRVATPAAAAPAGAVSHLEMSELLSPGHEGGITPVIEGFAPQRTGATGATILNNLVDEIEKGLERDLARIPLEIAQQHYRRVVPCHFGPGAAPERRARE